LKGRFPDFASEKLFYFNWGVKLSFLFLNFIENTGIGVNFL
jgi:hypothetical protein